MSTNPEYLRERAKQAEIAGNDVTAEALNAEADELENAPANPAEGVPR